MVRLGIEVKIHKNAAGADHFGEHPPIRCQAFAEEVSIEGWAPGRQCRVLRVDLYMQGHT
jgi:hypothetical protein